ncbi:unnamed protein product [Rhizophagus irregularis]|nr:unnamed protein product [Rhizophagus irregularis]
MAISTGAPPGGKQTKWWYIIGIQNPPKKSKTNSQRVNHPDHIATVRPHHLDHMATTRPHHSDHMVAS